MIILGIYIINQRFLHNTFLNNALLSLCVCVCWQDTLFDSDNLKTANFKHESIYNGTQCVQNYYYLETLALTAAVSNSNNHWKSFTPLITPRSVHFLYTIQGFWEFNYKYLLMNKMPSIASQVIRCKHHEIFIRCSEARVLKKKKDLLHRQIKYSIMILFQVFILYNQ